MSEQFGSFFPIWQWPPALVAIFVFSIGFVAVMLIRKVFEGKFYWERWWSFRIGDTIGLPVFAGFAAVVVSDGEFTGFYTELWWHLLVFCVGFVISFGLQVKNLMTGFFTGSDVFIWSEAYHTIFFGVMFYLVSTTLVAGSTDREPVWATILACVGLGVWIICVIIDGTSWVDKTPGRRK